MVRSGKEVYLADDVSIIVSEINNFAYYKASGGCARILQGNMPLSAAKIRRSKRQNEKSFVVYYIICSDIIFRKSPPYPGTAVSAFIFSLKLVYNYL